MTKKINFTLLVIGIIIFFNCFSQEVKQQNLRRPVFDFQKTYLLRQVPAEFITNYNVWKNVPLNLSEYPDLKTMLNDRYFTARKRFTLDYNKFIINDKVNKKTFNLEESETIENNIRLLTYSINDSKETVCTIKQIEEKDFLNYDILYKTRKYQFNGVIKKLDNNIHSFEFSVKNQDKILGFIFKEFRYSSNEYEIIINQKYNDFEDSYFICFGVFVDQILKQNGYRYKGE
ncbi:MAG: hypothetical protein JXB50_05480 [Spirochaetes bacterium]|nr:hypothetical protein [Spirochaetota bacterium]